MVNLCVEMFNELICARLMIQPYTNNCHSRIPYEDSGEKEAGK